MNEMTLDELADRLSWDVDELRAYIARRLARVSLPAADVPIAEEQLRRILRGMHRRGESLPEEFAHVVSGSRSVLEGSEGSARRRRQQATRDAAWQASVRERERRDAQRREREEERARDFAARLEPDYTPRPWGNAQHEDLSDALGQARELLHTIAHAPVTRREPHHPGPLRLATEPQPFARVMARRREAVRVLDRQMMPRLVCDVVLLDVDERTRDMMRRADDATLRMLHAHIDALFEPSCSRDDDATDAYAPRVHEPRDGESLFEVLAMPDLASLLAGYISPEAFAPDEWTRLVTMLTESEESLDLPWLARILEDDTLLMRCLLPAECARAQHEMIEASREHVLGEAGQGARITLRAHNENSAREFELFVGDAGAAAACISHTL